MGSTSRWTRTAKLILGLALLVALVAAPSIGTAATIATVQGTITNSSAAPLSGIHVIVQGATISTPYWADGITGPAGTYSIGVPEAGDYSVSVSDPSGVYLTDLHYLTNVTAGTVTSNFMMLRPGGFSGTVTDALTSAPVQQIEVQSNFLGGDFEYMDGFTLTDQYGQYTVGDASPGPHAVYFYDGSARPTPYAGQWFSGASTMASATTVTVLESGIVPNINAALATGTVLGGRVTDAGSGIALGSTIITIQNDDTADFAWTSTSADGTYRMAGLPAGNYTVTALSPQDDYVNFSQPVVLTDNLVLTNVDFAMTPAAVGYLTGRAVDAAVSPVGGIEVSLAMGLPTDNNPVVFSTVTASDGTFSLPPRTGSITLTFFDPTGAHPQLVTTVVAAGTGALGDFTLGVAGTITGTVTDVNAQPIAGVFVRVWDAADPVAPLDSATTGLDGSYSIVGLPAGSYRLSFDADTYQPEYYNNAQTFAGSTVVVLAGNAGVANAVLSRPDAIAGVVTDIGGLPSVGTLVEIWHIGPNGLELAGSAITDVNGAYSVGSLVSGDHLIRLTGGLGAGYVIPGGQWLTPFDALAAHYTFPDSLAPQAQLAFVRYAFDTVAPAVTIDVTAAHSAAPWYSQPATVTLTATDAGSGVDQIFYSIDGGAAQTYTGPFAISAPGTHVVTRWATDLVGNESSHLDTPVNIDVTAPTPSIVVTAAHTFANWHSSPATVTLSAVDAQSGLGSISYTIDGGTTQTYTVPFTITADGPHTVVYWATDAVANESTHLTQAVDIDAVAPTPSIALAASQTFGAWHSSPTTVTLSAVDAESGLASISYTLDGGATQTYSAPFAISADGPHTVVYWATDNVANESSHLTQAVDVDAVAPTVSPITFAAVSNVGDSYSSPTTVTLAATDAESGVAQVLYTINGGATQVYSGPFAVTASGLYAFEYWAVDNVGNVAAHQTATILVGSTVAGVTGTVTDGVNPLPGMHVVIQRVSDVLTPLDPIAPYWAETTTGADGTYAFGVPEPGTYSVRVDDPTGVFAAETKVVTTVAGQVSVLDFVLGATGNISGSVVDSSTSAPLQSIDVESLRLAGDFEYWDGFARTNPYGVYTITGAAPGPHAVLFSDSSDRAVPYASQYYNGVTDLALATTVTVTPGATTSGINARMVAGTTISGTVTDSVSGLPVGLEIIQVLNDATADELWTSTAADGTYRVTGLPFGTYTVLAQSQAGDYVDATTLGVVLDATQTSQVVDFALVPSVPGYLTGLVVDPSAAPIAGVEVYLSMGLPSANGPVVFSTVTAANGTFSLPPRTGDITLTFVDPSGSHPNLTATVVAPGTGPIGTFVMGSAGKISGTVHDAGGQPIDGAVVFLWDAADNVAPLDSATVHLAGTYSFGDLAAGTYKVGFVADGYQSEYFDNATAFATATTVTVPAAGTVTANAVLSPAGTIAGVVTDIADLPSVGTVVELWHVGPNGLELAGSTVSGLGGSYSVSGLVSGDYLIRLSGGLGSGYVLPGGQWLTVSTTLAARYNVPDSITPVTVTANVRYAFDTVAPVVGISVTAAHSAAPWYSQPATVTLTATDAGSGVDQIFYSIDGGATQTYTGPFAITLPGTHVVTRWATDLAGNESAHLDTPVNIDVTAPTPSIAVTAAHTFANWHSSPATVTLSAVDAESGVGSISYTIDGGATQTYSAPFAITADGPHTVVYWATDAVANESSHLTQAVDVDAVAPTVSIDLASGPTSGGFSLTTTVTLSAVDTESGVASISYRIDGGATQTYTGPFAITADGTHTVTYWATDNVGNASTPASRDITTDSVAPTVSIALTSAHTFGVWHSSPTTVTLSAVDTATGVASISYTLDGGATQTYSGPFSIAADGVHTVVYWATDNVGNVSPHLSQTVNVDATAPEVSATADPPAVDGWFPATAVTLTATDGGSGVANIFYTVNGGPVTTYTDPIQLNTTGRYDIEYWAVDNVANETQPHETLSLDVDADAPTTPGDLHWTSIHPTSVRLAWSASSDADSGLAFYEIYADGVLLDTTTDRFYVVAGLDPNTAYHFAVAAVDVVGNRSAPATLDVTTPASEITGNVGVGSNVHATILVPFNGTTKPFLFTFDQVTETGTLSVTPLGSQPPFTAVPDGLRAVGGFYDVSFTGTFTGHVHVTMPYDDRLPNFRALTLQLLHWLDGSSPDIIDVTVDTTNHTVTFELATLSPILLAEPDTNSAATDLTAAWKGTSSTTVSPAYGVGVVIQGRLHAADGSTLYSAAVVDVQQLIGGVWQTIGQATRSSSGLYSRTINVKDLAVFRFSFAGDPVNDASVSQQLTVKPHVRLSLNSVHSSYRHNHSFTVSGKISPAHAAGSRTTVYVKLYRLRSGHWRIYQTVAAKIGSTGTTFSATVNLKTAGRWKLVPFAPTDSLHASTTGTSRTTRAR